MHIAIVGLPQCGKTTVFNALTGANVPVGDYAAKAEPNFGVAHVPDDRLERLAEMFQPRRPVYAEMTYVDLPGLAPGATSDSVFRGEHLQYLQRAEALLHVVRGFENDTVPHPKGEVDWRRDVKDVTFDILFSDIDLLERRIERIQEGMKSVKASERAFRLKEIDAIKEVQAKLEEGVPLRGQSLSDSARTALQDTFLLSALPYLVALNIGEAELGRAEDLETELEGMLEGPETGETTICGRLEMELSQMTPEEQGEFRESLGAGEPGLSRMIRLSYQALGLASFLTVGDDEVRAWTIRQGAPAVKAAGKVHSDIERGFIRAEVVSYDDLVRLGGLPQARKAGVLRSEGREYRVQDGDVVNFLFSV